MRPDILTPEEREAMDRKITDALELGWEPVAPKVRIALVTVPIPECEARSTLAPALFGRDRKVAVPHLTYVIRSGEFVKIGTTANVENRVRELMISNPHEVTALAVIAGGREVEGSLHRRFKAHRHRHEWFRIEGPLAEWIEGGCVV